MFTLYTNFIYTPLYNGLIYLMDTIPWVDAGVAVLIFTVIVRLILFPLAYKATKTQLVMKLVEPELNQIKEKHKDNKQEQARLMMQLYKDKKINPFSSIFLIILQIPIIIALYSIFLKAGLPEVNSAILYSFVKIPEFVDMNFLGLIDISKKSILLSLAAAVSQFVQIKYAMPAPAKLKEGVTPTFKDDLARSMHFQMKYIMPVIVFFFSYSVSAVVALYWTVSNLFAIGQEIYVRKTLKKG